MKMRLLIVLICFAQVAALAWMAGEREWILACGEKIWLQTGPVDPRDPFRGDYVRLRYPTLDYNQKKADTTIEPEKCQRRGMEIFTSLVQDSAGTWQAERFSAIRPNTHPFIRGHMQKRWNNIDYGIGALFTEQGKAVQIERPWSDRRFPTHASSTPLEMEVSLGSQGTAVLTGKTRYFLPLMGWNIRQESSNEKDRVELHFYNSSDSVIAMALPENLFTIRLNAKIEKIFDDPMTYQTDSHPLLSKDWVTLAPGESIVRDYPLSVGEIGKHFKRVNPSLSDKKSNQVWGGIDRIFFEYLPPVNAPFLQSSPGIRTADLQDYNIER